MDRSCENWLLLAGVRFPLTPRHWQNLLAVWARQHPTGSRVRSRDHLAAIGASKLDLVAHDGLATMTGTRNAPHCRLPGSTHQRSDARESDKVIKPATRPTARSTSDRNDAAKPGLGCEERGPKAIRSTPYRVERRIPPPLIARSLLLVAGAQSPRQCVRTPPTPLTHAGTIRRLMEPSNPLACVLEPNTGRQKRIDKADRALMDRARLLDRDGTWREASRELYA